MHRTLDDVPEKNEYRKLTTKDLEALGLVIPSNKYKEHIAFAKKYYPLEATSLVLVVNSEYNDNTYDNRLSYVIVYNKDGNELPPLKATAKECRQQWFELPIPGFRKYGGGESDEPLDDIVIPLNGFPDLYMKVSG